jgi:hypothetical protein
VVRDVLGRETKVHAYIVWVPMLEGDSLDAARLEASLYSDKRISHFWDGEKQLSTELGARLGVKQAWDVYLIYGKRSKWPVPDFWMHQLDGVKLAPWLDSQTLRDKFDELH